jgi:hypothetical protein
VSSYKTPFCAGFSVFWIFHNWGNFKLIGFWGLERERFSLDVREVVGAGSRASEGQLLGLVIVLGNVRGPVVDRAVWWRTKNDTRDNI